MVEFDALVVGAGFAGSVAAERLASHGWRVLVIDRRPHSGGNAHDEMDAAGVLIHRYGPHIFHTNSARVFEYLSRFTEWRPYEHRVLSCVDGRLVPFPINLRTINLLYGLDLDEEGMRGYLEALRAPRQVLRTSEDVVVNTVGWDLYRKFYYGYTRKQWGLEPNQLSASVTARIPVRTNADDRYFEDRFQAMPAAGYAALFRRLLDHPNIALDLGADFRRWRNGVSLDGLRIIVYTGPIDEYFDGCYGSLPYRSLRFEHQHFPNIATYQPAATVNYPNEHAYTRITEFKHLTGQECSGTSIVKEYPCSGGDPYYPVPNPDNEGCYQQYKRLAKHEPRTVFLGRLAQYRYYNMDQVVAAALKAAHRILQGNVAVDADHLAGDEA